MNEIKTEKIESARVENPDSKIEIQAPNGMNASRADQLFAKLESNLSDPDKVNASRILLPRNGGEWSGKPGNSVWKPDREVTPGDRNGTNPEHKTWGTILDSHGIDQIPFKKGEANFSEVSKGTVRIEDFSRDRSLNFDQADEKLAKKKGCSPEEVESWRKSNNYTWHECNDCKTMQKVPTEVHGNISHSGGISAVKSST